MPGTDPKTTDSSPLLVLCSTALILLLAIVGIFTGIPEHENLVYEPTHNVVPTHSRAMNYSFTLSGENETNLFYLDPGTYRETRFIINNTGLEEDSYIISSSEDEASGWTFTIPVDTDTILPGKDFNGLLKITAPHDLFTHTKVCTIKINVTSRNMPLSSKEMEMTFIMGTISLEVDLQLTDGDGKEMDTWTIEENRDNLLFLKVTNRGNINDRYDIALGGISAGWNAFFTPGTRKIDVELGPMGMSEHFTATIPLVINCEANSTDTSTMMITVNSTADTNAGSQQLCHILSENLLKQHQEANIFLDATIKYLESEPGSSVLVKLLATNTGENDVSFKPILETILPSWLKQTHEKPEYCLIEKSSTTEFNLMYMVGENASAGEDILLTFSGDTKNHYSRVFGSWFHLRVKEVVNLYVEIDSCDISLEEAKSATTNISIENRGNIREKVNIYIDGRDTNEYVDIDINETEIELYSNGCSTITIIYSLINIPLERDILTIAIDVFSHGSTHTFLVNITVESKNLEVEKYLDVAFADDEFQSPFNIPGSGQKVLLNFSIINLGNMDTGRFHIDVQTLNSLGSISQHLYQMIQENMAPDENSFYSLLIEFNEADQKIMIRLDSLNELDELNESNNLAEISLDLKEDHDLDYVSLGNARESNLAVPVYISSGAMGFLALLVGSMYIFGTESTRYSMLGLIVPLYSRLSRDDVLTHDVRERIYQFVKNNPGEHYRFIQHKLDLKNGTLAHHLHTLENNELIVSKKDGPYRRFFPPGQMAKKNIYLTGLRCEIYEFIKKHPGLNQKELSIQIGQKPPTINYHITNLRNMGLVKVKKMGRKTLCYPVSSGDEL